MSPVEPAAAGACVAVAVALDTAGSGGVPAGPAPGDGVSDATAMPAGADRDSCSPREWRPSAASASASARRRSTRGVGVTVASGVAPAAAGTVGNDCGVIAAWARSCVVSVAPRREPTATATTIVASSRLAAKTTSIDLRHASSAASSFAVRSDRSDARRIGVSPATTSRELFALPPTADHGHRPHDASNERMRLARPIFGNLNLQWADSPPGASWRKVAVRDAAPRQPSRSVQDNFTSDVVFCIGRVKRLVLHAGGGFVAVAMRTVAAPSVPMV